MQYVEYYNNFDRVTVEFDEYYDLEDDPYQLRNLLGDTTPANDPPPTELQPLAFQVAQYRSCIGTTTSNPCP